MSKSIPPSADQPAAAAAPTPSTTTTSPSASSSSSSPTTSSTTSASSFTPSAANYYGTHPAMHAAGLAAAVLAPIGLMLPPRGFGPRNLFLAAGAFFATSQLTYDYTGQSLYQRFQRRANAFTAKHTQDLPPAAMQRQAAMQAERERRRQQLVVEQQKGAAPGGGGGSEKKEDWVKEVARRERETFAAGGGYWDLILGQIGEVATDLMGKGKGGMEKKEEGGEAEKTPAKPPAKPEDSKK